MTEDLEETRLLASKTFKRIDKIVLFNFTL